MPYLSNEKIHRKKFYSFELLGPKAIISFQENRELFSWTFMGFSKNKHI